MRLREFKALMLCKLQALKADLMKKYPDRAERINQLTDLLVSKTYNLRVYTLSDYIFSLHLASKEFEEFEKLIPTPEVVEELIKEGEV